MTEEEWLECANLQGMLTFLNATVSERKFRLTECAFHRRLWHRLTDERSRRAVEVAERFADGQATRDEYRAACVEAEAAFRELLLAHFPDEAVGRSFWGGAVSAAQKAASSDYDLPELFRDRENPERFRNLTNLIWMATAAYPIGDECVGRRGYNAIEEEQAKQAVLLRELFAPFRPATLNPAWLTHSVVSLAHAAYEERDLPAGHLDPGRLAVLSDALEEAGCDDAELLSHLRSPGPHVRGCWALDLILGRS